MVRNLIKFLKDESGQTAAEMVLLFGGVLVITVVALAFYNNYTSGIGEGVESEAESLTNNITSLKDKFQ